jgi:hypothetical protein
VTLALAQEREYTMYGIDYVGYGRKAGCPFCIASTNNHFSPGERIRLLSGSRAGKQATVLDPPEHFKNDPNMILVQSDEDDPSIRQMVNLDLELVELLPSAPVPPWAPPISIRKTYELHECIINFCEKSTQGSSKKMHLTSLYLLIWHIWKRRLPLEPKEVWNMLEAHGVPLNWRTSTMNILRHGLSLLMTVYGKKPVKKFRVEPMSITVSPIYGFSE